MNFWSPDISTNNYLEKGRFILAWRLAIVTTLLFVLLTINFSSSTFHFVTYLICFFITGGSLIVLHYLKNARFVYLMAATLGTLIVSFNLVYFNDIYQAANIVWKVFIISYTFFGLGKKWGVATLILNAGSVIYYALFMVNDNIQNIPEIDLFGRISLTVELSVVTFLTTYVIYQFVSINDKSHQELLEANKELINKNKTIESQNEEKTTLVKEIHHRVKNNLQIIISLLRLQKNELKSEESKKQFSQAINRIMVMSLIHRKLYQEEELAKVKVESYLQELSDDIKSLSDIGFKTKISIDSSIDKVGLKTIVPLGLLINELVSNSIKHAFENSETNIIRIKISPSNKNYFNLIYSDSGNWKEPNNGNSSFGLELIKILSEQLDGEVERISDSKGTKYEFSLKNIEMN